jgi:glyoxylate reductase
MRRPSIQVGDQPAQFPSGITRAPSGMRRATARISAMVMSAVSSVRTPGVLVTVMPRASAFGLQIHYHNRRRVSAKIEEELHATYWDSLDQMLARMDIVSINCPHTPATYHLLSARRLKLLRPQAYVVNTARGEVIDENALIRMIAAGELAGAGLDVFEHEPAVNPKLARLAREGKVVLLPHMGSATLEGRVDMGEKVIVNIRTFMDGHKPPDRVLPSML